MVTGFTWRFSPAAGCRRRAFRLRFAIGWIIRDLRKAVRAVPGLAERLPSVCDVIRRETLFPRAIPAANSGASRPLSVGGSRTILVHTNALGKSEGAPRNQAAIRFHGAVRSAYQDALWRSRRVGGTRQPRVNSPSGSRPAYPWTSRLSLFVSDIAAQRGPGE